MFEHFPVWLLDCTRDLYTDYLISFAGQTPATALSALHAGFLTHDKVTRWLGTPPARARRAASAAIQAFAWWPASAYLKC